MNFDEAVININKKVTSDKTKHGKAKKKLNDLAEKVKQLPTKGLTKDIVFVNSVLNSADYFIENGSKIS